MKKVLCSALALVMAISICGCSAKPAASNKITKISDLEGKNIGFRTFSDGFNADSAKESFSKMTGTKLSSVEACEAGTDNAILKLQSGKINALVTAGFEADYYAKMNDKLAVIDFPQFPVKQVAYMGVAKDKTEVFDIVNSAISELKKNGVMAKLTDKYVSKLTKDTQKEKITIPVTKGAQTIKVAVTGSAMPLDYFDASGNPSGFDAALLAEIAKLKGVNFEISTYEPNGGLAAVTSGKADIYFCLSSDKTTYDSGTNKETLKNLFGILATDYYFESSGMKFIVNK